MHRPETDGDEGVASGGVGGGHTVLKPADRDAPQQAHRQDCARAAVHGEGVGRHPWLPAAAARPLEQYPCTAGNDVAFAKLRLNART